MSGKQKITWWVPRWAFVPGLRRSLQQCVFNRGSIMNIVGGSVLASAVIIVALKIAFPALVVPNLWPAVIAIPGVFVAMILQFAILLIVPPSVTLREDRILKSHGQSGLLIKASDFLATQIYVHSKDRVRLKIRYRQRKHERTVVLGVPPNVDLEQLVSMLPVTPAIRDARLRLIPIRQNT